MPTKAQLQEQLKRERELADSKYKELEEEHQGVKDRLYKVNQNYNTLGKECDALRSKIHDLDQRDNLEGLYRGEAQAYRYALELQHGLHGDKQTTTAGMVGGIQRGF